MRKPENLPRHELIGLYVEVSKAKDPKKVGICGRVVDETRNLLKIEFNKKEVKIPKKECEFIFTLPEGQKVQVAGELLFGRPEERLKKKLPKKWQYLKDKNDREKNRKKRK